MGSTANITRRLLAKNLTGEDAPYGGCLGTGVVKLAEGLNAGRTGLTEAQTIDAGYDVITATCVTDDKALLVLHGRFPYLGYPRCYRKEDYICANDAMAQMGITELADTLLENLSGGQRQSVYIAMALAQDTPVVLLDEPTTFLDIRHQLQLMQQARLLARRGKTVLMVIHDLPRALHTADKLILMDGGTVVSEGTPEKLFARGILDTVFHVKLGRVKTESGWCYYCEEGRE